jgi:hypothetical protein
VAVRARVDRDACLHRCVGEIGGASLVAFGGAADVSPNSPE